MRLLFLCFPQGLLEGLGQHPVGLVEDERVEFSEGLATKEIEAPDPN